MQTEDRQIIHQCLNGDTAMFGFLVDKYREGVYALAYSRLGNFHDAQDIAQEAFIKAYRKLHTLRHWDNFALWLSAITNNLCKNFIRAKSNRPDREFADDQSQEIIDHTSVDSYRESQADESLKEALDSLPVIYRQVLVLHYLSGYTSMDIAYMLGISVRTVAERLRVGRERLKEEMVSMMSTTLKEQRLPAGFTFKIVEMVKRIRIHPITQGKGLPWGLSLATGVIITVFCLNPYMPWFSQMDTPTGSPLPSKTKVLKTGEIPVDILKTSEITVISSKVEKGKGGEQKQPDAQKALFMSSQGQGDTWTKKADMPTARWGLSTCVINGKIYAIGGCYQTIEEYDPEADKWIDKGWPLKDDQIMPEACAVDNTIYLIGGYSQDGNNANPVPTVRTYNPMTDELIKKADMPNARWGLLVSVVNGKIYTIGGRDTGNINAPNVNPLSFAEEYDPVADKWTKKADMPTGRWYHAISALNGRIYAIGGMGKNKEFLSSVEEYDPTTDKWAKKADMGIARSALTACAVNGKIYAIGGQTPNFQFTPAVEAYDPLMDKWAKKADMGIARAVLSASAVNGRIYAIGGQDISLTMTGAVEEYTPEGWPFAVFPQNKLPKTWGNLKSR